MVFAEEYLQLVLIENTPFDTHLSKIDLSPRNFILLICRPVSQNIILNYLILNFINKTIVAVCFFLVNIVYM